MSPDEAYAAIYREPHGPVRVHVTGGVRYDVLRPEWARVGRSVLVIGLRKDVASPFFDEPVMVELRHVERIEPIVEAAAAG